MNAFSVSDDTVLASGYNPLTRPTEATTEVNIGLSLTNIDEVDLENQIFGASGWIIVKWIDERLAWDPATNGGIKSFFGKGTHIWKPELALDSLFEDRNAFTDDISSVRYDYKGAVVWQQRRNFRFYCKFRKDYFPDERQTCTLDVVGSSYNISEVSLGFIDTAIDTQYIRKAPHLKVSGKGNVSSTVVVTIDNETLFEYPKLVFWITIKRAYQGYFRSAITMTTACMGLTFILPIDCGEKLAYIMTLFLSQIFLVEMMYDSMPQDFIRAYYFNEISLFSKIAAFEVIFISVMLDIIKHQSIDSKHPKLTRYIVKMGYIAAIILRSPLREKLSEASKSSVNSRSETQMASAATSINIERSTMTQGKDIEEFNAMGSGETQMASTTTTINAERSMVIQGKDIKESNAIGSRSSETNTENPTMKEQNAKDASSLIEILVFCVYIIKGIIFFSWVYGDVIYRIVKGTYIMY